MKAFTYSDYGPPEKVLALKEVDKPIPSENEVVIKVVATALNDYDWSMITGKPRLYRLMFGLFKPKFSIPGMELSGTIDKIGANVTNFKIGDAVYGDISDHGFGTYAEYTCIHEMGIIKMPKEMDYTQAAALPHAGLLAWQALEMAGIKERQNILINGAGGGVGTIALQLCKHKNCEVTGVDSGDKLEKMQTLGFDHVLDYKKQDFTKTGKQYDIILDCKTNKSPFSYLKSLRSDGNYITVGGAIHRLFSLFVCSKLLPLFTSKRISILALKPNKGLNHLGELVTQNKLKCQIDGPYTFEELPRLVQFFGEGKHQGKVIVNVAGPKE